METQVLTSNGTVQSGNVSAEYMATHDLSENKHSFVSYIKKDGKQCRYNGTGTFPSTDVPVCVMSIPHRPSYGIQEKRYTKTQ